MRRPIVAIVLALVTILAATTVAAAVQPTPGASSAPSTGPVASDVPPDATESTAPSASPADPTAPLAAELAASLVTSPDDGPVGSDPATPEKSTTAPSGGTPKNHLNIPKGAPDPTGRYLVMLKSNADSSRVMKSAKQHDGVHADQAFRRAFHGFSARLDAKQRRDLLADPDVLAVVPDQIVELTSQTTPTGVLRIGGKRSSVAAINNVDTRVDADVAIVDTGIAKHSDLNVAGGYNCATSDHTAWRDKNDHGTHVAGTVAALDNNIGVVGVAPGARVWGVRILNDDGYGLLSWYVCGLDWILAQRDPVDPSRPLFEAVNMSVTKWGTDDHDCGATNKDILHAAICRVVAGGITVVAAAANDSGSASKRVPASYNEVITVSALADTDGKSGGLGGHRCYSWGGYDVDDTFADFSNYGGDVDIMAPGKCIWSTIPGGYAYMSGTSMAAPTVTGAVALYKASRPKATPFEVKEALRYLGNLSWRTSTDPDSTHEPLLDVSKLGKLGSFNLDVPDATAPTGESGGTAEIPVSIARSSTFFERVRFSVTNLPDGWSATFSPSSLIGWSSDKTELLLTVPKGTPEGTYGVGVSASNQGRIRTQTLSVTVTSDNPTAQPPTVRLINDTIVGTTSSMVPNRVTVRVDWPAATDASSGIGGYHLQRRYNGGAWGASILTSGTATGVSIPGLYLDRRYEFRLRAKDGIGNWSPWVSAAVPFIGHAISDRSILVTYTGSWTKSTVASSTDRRRSSSTKTGSTATVRFNGRGIGLVMPKSSTRGQVTVWLDDVLIGTVDTRSSTSKVRRIVFHHEWATLGAHKLTVKVLGTSGRPLVSVDGFVVLR